MAENTENAADLLNSLFQSTYDNRWRYCLGHAVLYEGFGRFSRDEQWFVIPKPDLAETTNWRKVMAAAEDMHRVLFGQREGEYAT